MASQFKSLANDEAKAKKKAAKKEQQERFRSDVTKVAATLEIQVQLLLHIMTLQSSFFS